MSDTPEATLAALRTEIDSIDQQLIALLKQRIGVVGRVGQLKHAHWPGSCHIRPARETQMHRAIFEAFRHSDFLPEAAVAIWRHIISASTHIESPLYVAAPPALGALARSYFGEYVFHLDWEEGALPPKATLAILPFPAASNAALWQRFLAHQPGWRIFAYLPVVLHGGKPQALALAPVACEPSGADVSYFSGGHMPAQGVMHGAGIWSMAGYHPEHAGATFLGAHGVPIRNERVEP